MILPLKTLLTNAYKWEKAIQRAWSRPEELGRPGAVFRVRMRQSTDLELKS